MTCAFGPCERTATLKGLCPSHYQQQRKGKPLTPLRRATDATARDAVGRKFCPACDTWKAVDQFYQQPRRKDGLNGNCKPCCVKKAQKYYVPNPRPERDPVCAFDGCGKDSINGPLCQGHAQQKRKGKPLTPLRRKVRSTDRDANGRKLCSGCDGWMNIESFHANKRTSDGLASICKHCESVQGALRKFNITRERYDQMLLNQGGACAICGGQSSNGERLSVDHDHGCCPERGRSCGKCVRGLLCNDCNRCIGMMRDDPKRLRNAAAYLEGVMPT